MVKIEIKNEFKYVERN